MSDATPSWSLADAALLQQLRTQAGIDRASVARGTCLSLAQLCQLEDGGDSSFYSPAIKRAAGRRALAWLQSRHGAEHPTVQAQVQPQVQTRVQMPLQTRLQEAMASLPERPRS